MKFYFPDAELKNIVHNLTKGLPAIVSLHPSPSAWAATSAPELVTYLSRYTTFVLEHWGFKQLGIGALGTRAIGNGALEIKAYSFVGGLGWDRGCVITDSAAAQMNPCTMVIL